MGIEIRLLGEFSAKKSDIEISGLSTRHQSLLAFLALYSTTAVQRSEAAFKIWVDSRESQALTNLRKSLHQIRNILQSGDFIKAESHTLQLDLSQDDQIDVVEFLKQIDLAEQARAASDMDAEQSALEAASTVYSGDLLPHCYDEWILPERERLRNLFIQAADRLTALLEIRQHYRDAIKQALKLLQIDNLREATYRTLIRLHALNDDRAAALNVYHTCVRVLSKELGVDPDASTRELYEQLLKSETSLLRTKASATPVSHPLVGREEEWKTLLGEWKLSTSGELRMAVISGEAGIGKTRIAEEFLHWAKRQGIRTASAACYSAEGQISFASVTKWMRALPLKGLDTHWKNELSRLLPELRSGTISPQSMTEAWQKQIFFESMARAILTGNEPVLLLLDDLQWCDQDSLAWLQYFLRFDSQAKVLILVTVRAEELSSNSELQLLLVDLRAEGRLAELELQRLDEKHTAQLGSHLLRNDLQEDDAQALFHQSEGVPLFVVELANAGLGLGTAGQAGTATRENEATAASMGLPPRLRAVLDGRLARLSLPAKSVAESAAVIGREFDFDLLRKISEQEESITINALDELWQVRMVREHGGQYDFSHDKLREATLLGISPIRLRWLHQRAGEELDALQENVEYASIADHFERAGLHAKASTFYAKATGQAQGLFAFSEALDHLRKALLLETRHETLADLHEQRGDILMMLDRREKAFQAFSQAYGLSNNPLQRARVSRKQTTLTGRYDPKIARQKYQITMEELSRAKNEKGYWSEWIETQFTWLQVHYWTMDAKTVNTLLEELRNPVERHGSLSQKIEYHQRAIASAFVNERFRMSQSHMSLSQETIELAMKSDSPYMISNAIRQFGMVALFADQFDSAEAALQEAILLCETNGDQNSMLIGRAYLSLTHRRQHKPQDVREDTELLQEQLQRVSDNPAYHGIVDANKSWLANLDGDIEQARAFAHSALKTWRDRYHHYAMQWSALFVLLEIVHQEEKTNEVVSCVQSLLASSQQRLPPKLESALLSVLEANPDHPSLILSRSRVAIEEAKETGYL
jgi:DNA-binding SARP family transcriptional activator/tetratricopeptide (TPR) repeat protein